MAGKVLREYVPGVNDFLHFTELMNKNAAIDMKTTLSAANSAPSPKEEGLEQSLAKLPSATVMPDAQLQVDNLSIKTDEEKPNNTDLITSESKYPPQLIKTKSLEEYKAENNFLNEQDWYISQGIDPDRDYQDTVNTLNYEYQTSMANYGQNAENLYQMGLSNSGVSDIFQANAFSAYLSSMNEAAAKKINAKKQNKILYQNYVSEFDDAYKAYTDKINLSITNAFNTYADKYTADNEDSIRKTLLAQGMESSAVEQALAKMKEYQSTLPEGEKAENQAINEIYANYAETYSPETRNTVEQILKDSGKYDDTDIENALDKLDNLFNTSISAYVNTNNIKEISLESLNSLLGKGKTGEEDSYDNKLREKAAQMLNNALNNEADLANAWNLIGYEEAQWDALPDSDKMLAVLNATGTYKKKGLVTSDEADKIFDAWLKKQLEYVKQPEDMVNLYMQIEQFSKLGFLNIDKIKKENKPSLNKLFTIIATNHNNNNDDFFHTFYTEVEKETKETKETKSFGELLEEKTLGEIVEEGLEEGTKDLIYNFFSD